MMTSTNMKHLQRFSNFWSNVSKLTIADTVTKKVTDAIANGLSQTESLPN